MEETSFEYKDEAARFVKFRKKLEMSQMDMAKTLNTKQPNISKIESGERPLSFAHLRVLRKKFKLNINWYITGQGTMISEEKDKSTLIEDIGTIKKDYEDLSKLYDNLRKTVQQLVKDVYRQD